MKTLHSYLKGQLSRSDPHPAIDHSIRAHLHEDGRISFYIHPHGRDGETIDFWVDDRDVIKEKRIKDEPLPEVYREKVLTSVSEFQAFWGFGNNKNLLFAPMLKRYSRVTEIIKAIETVKGVTANYSGTDGDDYYVFRPHL